MRRNISRLLTGATAVLLLASCADKSPTNSDQSFDLASSNSTLATGGGEEAALPAAKSLGSQLGNPVPASVIVSANGLEWVWASPCAPNGCSGGFDVGHDGFEYATDDQWAARPPVSAFRNPDKCASPWFEHRFDHCDWGDGSAGYYGSSADWRVGPNGGQRHPAAETWLVRVSDPQVKDDCKKDGWEQYGFKNQGQCVRFIETGKDSR